MAIDARTQNGTQGFCLGRRRGGPAWSVGRRRLPHEFLAISTACPLRVGEAGERDVPGPREARPVPHFGTPQPGFTTPRITRRIWTFRSS